MFGIKVTFETKTYWKVDSQGFNDLLQNAFQPQLGYCDSLEASTKFPTPSYQKL